MSKFPSDVLPEHLFQENIAALATPLATSALAVIRTTGPDTIKLLMPCFSQPQKLIEAAGNTLLYGWLLDDSQRVDEVTLGVFRNPQSYTGEDSVEIYCHGSIPGIQRIMALLFSHGFRQAEPGEFTLRAFVNGKMDLTRAEAVQELMRAQSVQAQRLALNRLAGAVFEEIHRIKLLITDIVAFLSVQLDYPEEELSDEFSSDSNVEGISLDTLSTIMNDLRRLSHSYRLGRLYQGGARVVLVGRTNTGKSSLFNLFLKQERAIISDIPGTTRDYLEASILLDDVPIKLYDTAGIRDADELIEQEGIRRSYEVIRSSNIVLYLVDAFQEGGDSFEVGNKSEMEIQNRRIDDEHLNHIEKLGIPCVKLWTKVDLTEARPVPNGFLPISARTGKGLNDLQRTIRSILFGGIAQDSESELLIDSLRQKRLIDHAIKSLGRAMKSIHDNQPQDIIILDFQVALQALGEITGEVSSADILDRIFSKFCVGK